MYLGQRGATKLAGLVVKDLKPELTYPHQDMRIMQHKQHAEALEEIQKAHKDEAQKAEVDKIYTTVSGYSLPPCLPACLPPLLPCLPAFLPSVPACPASSACPIHPSI